MQQRQLHQLEPEITKEERKMSGIVSREIRLKQRPVGIPKESDFEIVEVTVAEPKAGEVLVRNIYMSVDPYMRGVVRNVALGVPLEGGCVGQVVQSGSESFQVGDHVLGGLGWREYYLARAENLSQIDPTLAPIQSFIGAVGMPGRTAYFGLLDVGEPKAGETVFVLRRLRRGWRDCLSNRQDQRMPCGCQCRIGSEGELALRKSGR